MLPILLLSHPVTFAVSVLYFKGDNSTIPDLLNLHTVWDQKQENADETLVLNNVQPL